MSICKKCGQEEVKMGAYKCKVCRQAYLSKWYQKNRETHDLNTKEWVNQNKSRRAEILKKSETKHKEKKLAYHREFYKNNKERYKEWRKNQSKEMRTEIKNRYRARKVSANHEKYSAKSIFEKGNHTCVYCGNVGKQLDHVIPLYAGGSDMEANLAVACKTCNCSKHVKTATEFMLPKFLKIKKQLEVFK